MTAVDVLEQLRESHPDQFTATHLRTTQRLVKAWRADQAKRMIRLGSKALTPPRGQGAVVLAPPQTAALGNVLG